MPRLAIILFLWAGLVFARKIQCPDNSAIVHHITRGPYWYVLSMYTQQTSIIVQAEKETNRLITTSLTKNSKCNAGYTMRKRKWGKRRCVKKKRCDDIKNSHEGNSKINRHLNFSFFLYSFSWASVTAFV